MSVHHPRESAESQTDCSIMVNNRNATAIYGLGIGDIAQLGYTLVKNFRIENSVSDDGAHAVQFV